MNQLSFKTCGLQPRSVSGTWDPCCGLGYCVAAPAFQFYPYLQRWPPACIPWCSSLHCPGKLLASLSPSLLKPRWTCPSSPVPHHPTPSAHQVRGKRQQHKPHIPSCAPHLSWESPAHGATGMEHLSASAWEALRSKCRTAEHREPWLSQSLLSGAVEAVPPEWEVSH